jgi:hypothetical protein
MALDTVLRFLDTEVAKGEISEASDWRKQPGLVYG